ncbi:UDP-N-acetyl-D-glucosamine 2-epimerase, UDP-hydrolysing [Candidatus Roizmanbacteria bacterium RIFCSPLOWO2_02_FULL_38_10]|uniref:UDP-N-acetyl-D-glucosamine 2-epimerase, UDP-hydrolysing n=1 Tax=Candidatus Roizmanbacteria bacterium RIFCSPLOWO2_02_FULL_38_10 TaxID=1802074 RepID=A0A1F7JNH9_9BACT|nr:MAG: UDP-N-acetyl-D-glucosamine 2-epimerase, UDP-hydrolysing [Candidatus Roizmanbacteria bacterium RIFCSPLOWO2_02_FULL_38_10]
MSRQKKIVYISGGRMDFGLMLPVLKAIKQSKSLDLQVYFTGLHLMREFGKTEKMVKKEFPNPKPLPAIYLGDEKKASVVFISDLLTKIVDAFIKNRPDITITLGDRPEMLAVAIASQYLGIVTAQIHAGDKTMHIDEIARHAITKLSHLFFVATNDAKKRVERLGEDQFRIHLVGAPGLDSIVNEKLPNTQEVYRFLNLKPKDKFILLLQHSVWDQVHQAGKQMTMLISIIKRFQLPTVVIYPNADAGARAMIDVIDKERNNPLFRIFPNVDRNMFLALEREAAVWVTNSSAGMIESGTFHTPVVNVGSRQHGRIHSANVILVGFDEDKIHQAIVKCLEDGSFLRLIKKKSNPWGDGKTASRIVKVLENIEITNKLLVKQIRY